MYTCTKFILISPNFIPTSPIIAFYFSIQMPRFNKYSYRCLFLINVLQISNVCLFSVLDSSKLKTWFIARPSNKKLPPYITTLTLSSIIFWYFSPTYNTEIYFWKIDACMLIFTWMRLCEYMHTCLSTCALAHVHGGQERALEVCLNLCLPFP